MTGRDFMDTIGLLFGIVAIPLQIGGMLNGTPALIPWPVLMVASVSGMIMCGISLYRRNGKIL